MFIEPLSLIFFVVDSPQLEKYSTNLEGVVAERTAELAAEKAKTDELVCRTSKPPLHPQHTHTHMFKKLSSLHHLCQEV